MKQISTQKSAITPVEKPGENFVKLTPSKYAELKGISERTVRYQIKNNLVESVKEGGSRFILVSLEEMDRIQQMENEIKTLNLKITELEKKQALTDEELKELKTSVKSIASKTNNNKLDLDKIKAILPNIDVSKKI